MYFWCILIAKKQLKSEFWLGFQVQYRFRVSEFRVRVRVYRWGMPVSFKSGRRLWGGGGGGCHNKHV